MFKSCLTNNLLFIDFSGIDGEINIRVKKSFPNGDTSGVEVQFVTSIYKWKKVSIQHYNVYIFDLNFSLLLK